MGGGGAARAGAVVILALLGGCGVRHDPMPAGASLELMTPADRTRLEAIAAARAGDPPDGYRIGPDDLLDVRIPDLIGVDTSGARPAGGAPVAEAPAYQQGLRVSAGGVVDVPFVGSVKAEGRSAPELADAIKQQLMGKGILLQPQVSVTVVEYRSRVVAVIGSVEKPGLYPLTRPGARLADLVWAAGGPSKDAGRVLEFKPVGTEAKDGVRVDLDVLLHATSDAMNPPVRAGDVMSVAPAGNVHVTGWVDRPGSYPVTRGLTVSGAVAAAGGQLFPADRNHVTVKRIVSPGDERSFTVDLDAVAAGHAVDVPLADGDVIRLSAKAGRLVPYGLWTIAREMVHVGGSVALF